MIVENKQRFIPLLFTKRQLQILEKYLGGEKLRNAEKTVLYSTIRRKTDALAAVQQEWHIRGEGMIPERVAGAKEILCRLNKPAFISGSFLYAEQYNDIDIFVLSKRRTQYHQGNENFLCITESDLRKPLFYSAAKCSVANFFIGGIKPIIQRPMFNDLIVAYELAINEILDNDDQKTIRDIIFEYSTHIDGMILDSFSLYQEFTRIRSLKQEERISIINAMTKKLLMKLYARRYLYGALVKFLRMLRQDIAEYTKSKNLHVYYSMLEEVKNESRRVEV